MHYIAHIIRLANWETESFSTCLNQEKLERWKLYASTKLKNCTMAVEISLVEICSSTLPILQ